MSVRLHLLKYHRKVTWFYPESLVLTSSYPVNLLNHDHLKTWRYFALSCYRYFDRQELDDWELNMQIGANSFLQEMQKLKGEITPSFGVQPNIMQ